ncbi:hypothetical protein TNCV_327381 [Trichonephila clavipes]|nr:hypothetical protein TNCV_327381 [Trichonephila clavipes]
MRINFLLCQGLIRGQSLSIFHAFISNSSERTFPSEWLSQSECSNIKNENFHCVVSTLSLTYGIEDHKWPKCPKLTSYTRMVDDRSEWFFWTFLRYVRNRYFKKRINS